MRIDEYSIISLNREENGTVMPEQVFIPKSKIKVKLQPLSEHTVALFHKNPLICIYMPIYLHVKHPRAIGFVC